jgi:hypothetical protein
MSDSVPHLDMETPGPDPFVMPTLIFSREAHLEYSKEAEAE